MYAVAGALDPDLYHRLAKAVFAEMRLAGYASVGEFHYLHSPDLAEAVVEAARAVGLRICLLSTLLRTGRVRRRAPAPGTAAVRAAAGGLAGTGRGPRRPGTGATRAS